MTPEAEAEMRANYRKFCRRQEWRAFAGGMLNYVIFVAALIGQFYLLTEVLDVNDFWLFVAFFPTLWSSVCVAAGIAWSVEKATGWEMIS